MRSLLILGDYKDPGHNKYIKWMENVSPRHGFQPVLVGYDELLKGDIKDLKGETIPVMFFFPFSFWDANCEPPPDIGVYGVSRNSYETFANFWMDVEDKLRNFYRDANLSFVVDPKIAYIDRDKILTHDTLIEARVPTTEMLPKDLFSIFDRISSGENVFIKSRYGSEGKGITYLSRDKWVTNYMIGPGNSVVNPDNEDWVFRDIDGNFDFLRRLLDLEVIVEREIVPPPIKGNKKSDVRAYVFLDSVEYMFVRDNDFEGVITNFSRGGSINYSAPSVLSSESIDLVDRISVDASRALKSGFMGVDVMFDGSWKKPRVLEAHAFPGYPESQSYALIDRMVQRLANET